MNLLGARFHGACGALLALLPRYFCIHEFHAALFLRFRCTLSAQRFRYVMSEPCLGDHAASDTFYYDPEASTALLKLLRLMAL